MKKTLPIIGVIIVIAIIAAAALGHKSKNSPATPSVANNSSGSTNSSSGSSSAGSQAMKSADKVSITNFNFSPMNIVVKKGTAVTWANNDSVTHTVTADSGTGPNSGNLAPGKSYAFTYDTAGTFAYHCSIHSGMHGSVTVTE